MDSIEMTSISKILQERRISEKALADFIGVDKLKIQCYELGLLYPDLLTLVKMSILLEVSTDILLQDFFDYVEKKKKEQRYGRI